MANKVRKAAINTSEISPSIVTGGIFVVPTRRAVDIRVHQEVQISPVFRGMSLDDKNRFMKIVDPLYQMLTQFEGFPQEVIDAVIESDEFWAAISCNIPMSSTTACDSVMAPLRHIITDLCA